MVRLPGYGDRRPGELSGGQRQRVALARAIVNRPKVLLLDEPLGALDLKLREQMQVELKSIQGEVGITFVYVTHDQDEALTMSDRIAVFNEGRIEQVGPPVELYEQPATEFVAGFVGVSNVIERDGERFTIRPEKIECSSPAPRRRRACAPSAAGSPRSPTPAWSPATRWRSTPGGELQLVRQNVERRVAGRCLPEQGREVIVGWRPEHAVAVRGSSTKEEESREKRRTPGAHGVADRREAWSRSCSLLPAAAPAAATAAAAKNCRSSARARASQPDLLGRLRRSRNGPSRSNKKTGCKVNDKVAGTSDEMVQADGDRPVRRGLGLGQRHRAPLGGRRRRPGQRQPGPQLQDGLRRPQRTSPTTPSKASTTGSRTAAAPTC